ncbi:MAG: glycosyltransferase family 39 protein [Planctomycetota bacterium]|nr:glycosyltransferase family 39 protein [Planctomycetota bacterium]
MPETRSRLREWAPLLLLLGAALAIRIVVAGFTNLVCHDGAAYYLPRARAITEGNWEVGFSASIPFLYPLLTAASTTIFASLATAGQAVSVIAGTLTLIPIYLLGRTLSGERTGLLAAALGTVCPLLVRYSAHAESDALYGLFLATSFLLILRGVLRPSIGLALGAGAAGGLAYLVRPEALGLFPLVGFFAVITCRRGRARPGPVGLAFAAFAFSFASLALPQVWITHSRTGEWTLSAKAGAIFRWANDPEFRMNAIGPSGTRTVWEEAFTDPDAYILFSPWTPIVRDPFAVARRYLGGVAWMIVYLGLEFGLAIIAAAVAGTLFLREGRRLTPGEGFLGAAVVFYLLTLPLFYVSRSMWVPLFPLLLPLAARRILLLMRSDEPGPAGDRPRPVLRWVVLLILLTLPQTFRPVARYGWRWRMSPEKEAGWLLADMMPQGGAVLSYHGRVALAAGAEHVPLPEGRPDEILRYASRRGVEWIAVDRNRLARRRPDLLGLIHEKQETAVYRDGFEIVIRREGNGRDVVVARRRKRPPVGTGAAAKE